MTSYDPPTPEVDALEQRLKGVSVAEYIVRLEELARELEMRLAYMEARMNNWRQTVEQLRSMK